MNRSKPILTSFQARHRMLAKRVLCLTMLVSWFNLISAQNIEDYTHYTVNDGLPSNFIYQAIEDADGFLWIGTDNGVCRFDGKEFQCKSFQDGLPNSDILEIFIDSDKRIWLSTLNPQPCYIQNSKIHCIDNPNNTFESPQTYLFHQKDDSTLTIFSTKKAIDLSLKSFEIVSIDSTISSSQYRMMSGLLTPHSKRSVNDKVITWSESANKFLLSDIVGKEEKSTSEEYLPHLKSRLKDLKLNQRRAFFHNDTLLALRTTKGLHFINTNTRKSPVHVILPTKNILRHMFDRLDNLWVCTKNDGLYKINPAQWRQKLGIATSRQDDKLINGILTQNNKILSHRNNKLFVLDHNLTLEKSIHSESVDNGIKEDHNIIEIRAYHDTIFTLTEKFLFKICIKEGEFKYHSIQSQPKLIKGAIKTFLPITSDTILYLSTRITEMVNEEIIQNISIPTNARATCAAAISNSEILIGTVSGSYLYDRSLKKITKYPNKLESLDIAFIIKKGAFIYIGTRVGSLYKFHMRGATLVQIEKKELRHTKINKALIHDNRLVIASNRGLYILNSETLSLDHHITHFDNFTGLDISHLATMDSSYIIANEHQLAKVPHSVITQHNSPDVHIETISINNKSKIDKLPPVLNYSERFISLDFSAAYLGQSSLEFEYQLIPNDPAPIRSNQQRVNFSNLAPGNYQFRIRSILNETNKGPYSEYKFKISQPWWRTKIFYLLCFISLASVLFYFYRQHQLRRQAKFKLLQQRLNTLHAQMNPHFLFNALQSLQYYIAKNDSKKANAYLTSFANLVRKTLESSAHDYITVENEISYLTSYLELEKEKLNDNLAYSIIFDDDKLAEKKIPSMVLQPFLENAILHGFADRTNCTNHINVRFSSMQKDHVSCIITDNGNGISTNKKTSTTHKSFATKAIEDKLNLLNKLYIGKRSLSKIKIRINNNNELANPVFETGTTIKLKLPILNHKP